MTKHPNSEQQSGTRVNPRLRLMLIRRAGIGLAGVLLVGLAGGAWRLWTFVHEDLAPLVEKNLSQTLDRPVELGEVTGFSLNGVQFGPSAIPQTATDPDRVKVDAVEVKFDPLQLLFKRILELDITLVSPDGYIVQNKEARWIDTTLAEGEAEGPIKTDLDIIRFRNATVVLIPNTQQSTPAAGQRGAVPPSPPPVVLTQLNGTVRLLENNQIVSYELQAVPATGGTVALQGQTRIKTQDTNLQIQAQNLLASVVSRLLKLPVDLQGGRVNGSLKVELREEEPALLFGNADLQGVTVQVPRVPQAFANARGMVRFQGSEIKLENVATSYGKVPLLANGTIDTQAGYNLTAQIPTVSVANAQQTLNLKLPVPVAGEVTANLQLTGPIEKPILSGAVASTKPARIDKVDFSNVSARFAFSTAEEVITFRDIQAKPVVGGQITGGGRILLSETPQLNFNLAAKNVPGDAIARIYGTTPPIQIGTVSATAQVTGSGENVRTAVQLQAPQATYPGTGEVIVTGTQNITFRNFAFNVAGGRARVAGNLVNQQWQAVVNASGVNLARLVNTNQLQNVSLQQSEFNGRLILSGTLDPFKVTRIRTEEANIQVGGGTVSISNIQLGDERIQAQVQASGVRLGRLLTNLPPSLQGPLAGTFQISGSRDNFNLETLQATGQARINVGGGTVTASNIQVAGGSFQAQLQTNNVPLASLTQGQNQLKGAVTGQFNVSGPVTALQPENLQVTGQGRVNIGGGTVTASNIQVAGGNFQAQLQTNNVPLASLPQVPQQFQGGAVTGQFNVSGPVAALQPENLQVSGQGRLNIAGGTVTASNIQVNQGRFQAQVETNDVQIQRLAQIPEQFQGGLTGQFNVSGPVAALQPENLQVTGEGRLNVAGGTVTASNIQVNQGNFQALVDASELELNRFGQELRGELTGQLEVAGRLDQPNLANLRAAGNVRLSEGIAGIDRPLTAQVAWNGERLVIDNATAPGLNASGSILARITRTGAPEISGLNLNVQAENYDLQDLPFQLPDAVKLAGQADFSGQITGMLPVPNIEGQLRLENLKVNDLAFEPALSGSIQSQQGRGLQLDVTGNQDRIAVNLDANNRPTSFVVRRDQAVATGSTQGENLQVSVENFPLQALNITPPANTLLGAGQVNGQLTGDFQVNLATNAVVGDVAIANPQIGRLQGDRFAGQFRYGNGEISLTGGEFVQGESLYALAGTLNQNSPVPQFQGKINVKQGKIQDVLTALQLFEFTDLQRGLETPTYATAAELNTEGVGLPQDPLLTQLRRFSEIEALLAQQEQQRREGSPVPSLADLKGTFSGEIAVNTAAENGVTATFDLTGQDFVWGKENEPDRLYQADQVIAQGSFENGVLTLLPLRIESDNSLVAFTGSIGGAEQSGNLRVMNFPVEVLENFVNLPVDIAGNLSGQAALAGSAANPRARGDLQLTEGTLNQKQVESAALNFIYADARLNFGSNVVVAGPEPIQITGSIPYKLPIAEVEPDSNQISLDVNVQNEGLALLNLLTDQVAFQQGEGKVSVQVGGTLQQPKVVGTASVNNATFTAQALPEPLTDVTGNITFDFDRAVVEKLQGSFSKGQVAAQGEIPISNGQQTTVENPLSVNLENLALNLKGLYQGGASGNVEITGSVLNPVIGGRVQLADGEVLLGQNAGGTTTVAGSASAAPAAAAAGTPAGVGGGVGFNDLQIALGDDVAITNPPILNFEATGDLTLNGSLNDLSPSGTIRLRRGGVNLFTTQFVLARGYEQTATFTPERGLDPELDIRLVAAVPEVTRSRVPTSPVSSEIAEGIATELGALQTVRVQARVTGPATQLADNLELTSDPGRTETEIVALLGGGFVETLGRGDTTLGLANLAGSALLGSVQGTITNIGNAVGLSELRLFPTLINDDEARRDNSTLGLAAEAGIDISRDISLSALRVLTANQPTQFGLNYRFDEDLRVRASTDFSDDYRVLVEYENRF